MEQTDVALDLLDALPGNAQRLDAKTKEALAASIRRDGFAEPVLLRPKPGGRYEVVSGNHRVEAARAAGLRSVPALVRALDDATARRLAVNLNTIHGAPDARALAEFLGEDFDAGVFLGDDLEKQLAALDDDDVKVAPLDLAAPPKIAWALACVPIAVWPQVAPLVEKLAAIPGVRVDTTIAYEPA